MKKIIIISSLFLFTAFMSGFAKTENGNTEKEFLSSWTEGNSKNAIINFVNDLTDEASPNYVKPSERITTFDNDGTLWPEKLYYFQLQFAIDRVKALAPEHPEWNDSPLFKAVLDNDIKKSAFIW